MHAAQAQTAECLVVGEIAIQHMVVILNKVDLLPAENRAKLVAKAKKRLAQTFAATKFAGCPMLAVSSLPGDQDPPDLSFLSGPFDPYCAGLSGKLTEPANLYHDSSGLSLWFSGPLNCMFMVEALQRHHTTSSEQMQRQWQSCWCLRRLHLP